MNDELGVDRITADVRGQVTLKHRHPGQHVSLCNSDDQKACNITIEATQVFFMKPEGLKGSSSGCSSTRGCCGRSSSKHSKKRHVQDSSSGSGSSLPETVTSRSHSFSGGCSGTCSNSSSNSGMASAQAVCGHRPKSFTAGQQHVHRHRLAASTAAHSSGSLEATHCDACCSLKRCSHPPHHHHHHHHHGMASGPAGTASSGSKAAAGRPRPTTSAAAVSAARKEVGGGLLAQHRRMLKAAYGPGHGAAEGGQHSTLSPGDPPELLMAESVNVQDIGKGFRSHWYSHRVLLVFDGHKAADPAWMLRQVPQQAGLALWLVKPPCSRQWVAVRLEGADNLQESLARCLHADGSCGPRGFKQRVLLDLQCRGFAVQFRWRPLKQGCGSVRHDLLTKLRRFDFALCDIDNNGCRPIELPDGRPVQSYPLVVSHMMKLFDQLFKPQLL